MHLVQTILANNTPTQLQGHLVSVNNWRILLI